MLSVRSRQRSSITSEEDRQLCQCWVSKRPAKRCVDDMPNVFDLSHKMLMNILIRVVLPLPRHRISIGFDVLCMKCVNVSQLRLGEAHISTLCCKGMQRHHFLQVMASRDMNTVNSLFEVGSSCKCLVTGLTMTSETRRACLHKTRSCQLCVCNANVIGCCCQCLPVGCNAAFISHTICISGWCKLMHLFSYAPENAKETGVKLQGLQDQVKGEVAIHQMNTIK